MVFTVIEPLNQAGQKLSEHMESKRRAKIKERISVLTDHISRRLDENENLEAELKQRDAVVKITRLIRICGGDTSELEANTIYQDIHHIRERITNNKRQIEIYNKELETNLNILIPTS